ncbi:MAG TPA: acetyl-CoA carboxylase biotin carboxylase subunit [Vicinamibacterales bacterium]|nr:acetyl-CoA carboxylase biotin carboxylase subunit [Vicinamibacterales bacterium]
MRRVLIANRGEIALRILRACREHGLETVAVYSDADAEAPHVRAADRAVRLGPAQAVESYLNVEAILRAAHETHADAIHPGYGFLSENAAFARACAGAGVVFVGPPADAIEQMGSKLAARALMERAGVPVVPGATPEDQTDAGILRAAADVGYPVLVKASAGGGGKGMRTVRSEAEAREAIPAARREAQAAFSDGTLYVEKLIERPRHVEVQIFGDAHGDVVHLFERECSVQRRHQKIVEESPSPVVDDRLRARMGEAAVMAARAAGYVNAGTIEFLLDGDGPDAAFHFLEMNTRLQVEHPVTEAVTGTDLVRAQLTVAADGRLPWRQSDLRQRGHAIECRVYAEDPAHQFLPQAGRLLLYREPAGPGLRIDSGVEEGAEVSVHYDPLLAKLIAYAETREAAIARAAAALRRFPILGIRTNVAFLLRVLEHPAFAAGRMHTRFVDAHLGDLLPATTPEPSVIAAAAALRPTQQSSRTRIPAASHTRAADPWSTIEHWGR